MIPLPPEGRCKFYAPRGPDWVGTRCSASGSLLVADAQQRVPTIELFHSFGCADGPARKTNAFRTS
jgi:hypothetical protein